MATLVLDTEWKRGTTYFLWTCYDTLPQNVFVNFFLLLSVYLKDLCLQWRTEKTLQKVCVINMQNYHGLTTLASDAVQ